MESPLFDHYPQADGRYDEMFDAGGQPRAHYSGVFDQLSAMSPADFQARRRRADLTFLQQGITFTTYGGDAQESTERIFPFDLVPRVITARKWAKIEAGLKQRIRALNLFLHDVYHDQKILRDGVVPADLVLGCDMVVVNDYWVLSKIRPERSTVVMNTYEAMPGTFTTRPDMQFPAADIVKAVSTALAGGAPLQVDATKLATALMGDAIAANLFILGYAWQQGLVPLSFDALMRAIELNGAAVDMNKTAFACGRLAAIDMPAVIDAAGIVRNAPTAAEATPHALPMLGATPNEASIAARSAAMSSSACASARSRMRRITSARETPSPPARRSSRSSCRSSR